MSRLRTFGKGDPVSAIADSAWRALILVTAPANQRGVIEKWGVTARGVVNSDKPIKVRLIRASDAGTGGSAKTAGKKNTNFSETPQMVYTHNFSTSPTPTGEPLDESVIHPQQGGQGVCLERGEWELAGGERAMVQYMNDGGTASIPLSGKLDVEE